MLNSIPTCIVGLNHTYQFGASNDPSTAEVQQRRRFANRMAGIVSQFEPTIVADESPDTDNPELLSLYPSGAIPVCIDIPLKR